MMMHTKQSPRARRIARGRAPLFGTALRPRISVQRTAKHFRAQAIDDERGHTIIAVADDQASLKLGSAQGIARAEALGTAFAGAAQSKQLQTFVFDRRGYRYHGRVKAFAESLRRAGLTL